jgi:hypothetical protein
MGASYSEQSDVWARVRAGDPRTSDGQALGKRQPASAGKHRCAGPHCCKLMPVGESMVTPTRALGKWRERPRETEVSFSGTVPTSLTEEYSSNCG